MKFLGKAAVMGALALTGAYSNLVFAHGFDKHHQKDDHHKTKTVCTTEVVSKSKAGPAAYHQTYGDIQHSNVTIQNFYLRTEDGQVVKVATDPMTVDLQDLKGFTKGLVLHLAQVDFPDGANEIHVAEIETELVKGSGEAVSADGSHCQFTSAPHFLNFYTAEGLTLGHDDYHVKIDYSALNALQLNVLTTVTQTKCCVSGSSCGHSIGWGFGKNGGKNSKSSCTVNEPQSKAEAQCRLVNRRHAILSIARAVDDAF